MAYNNNYRNNNYRNNSGYRNNNYNYSKNFNGENRTYDKPAFNGFDATKYKKPDIELKGLSGKIYRINGNFSLAFASQIMKTYERINKVTKSQLTDIEKFPELYDLLKEWTLELLNLNTEGITYSMEAVLKDFNDLYVMFNLLQYVSTFISRDAPDLVKEAQKTE